MSLNSIVSHLYARRLTGVLYHYTSLGGVLGIVQDQFLRATDARFFSDAAELGGAGTRSSTTLAGTSSTVPS